MQEEAPRPPPGAQGLVGGVMGAIFGGQRRKWAPPAHSTVGGSWSECREGKLVGSPLLSPVPLHVSHLSPGCFWNFL